MRIKEPVNFVLGLCCVACAIVNIINQNTFALVISVLAATVNLMVGLEDIK